MTPRAPWSLHVHQIEELGPSFLSVQVQLFLPVTYIVERSAAEYDSYFDTCLVHELWAVAGTRADAVAADVGVAVAGIARAVAEEQSPVLSTEDFEVSSIDLANSRSR